MSIQVAEMLLLEHGHVAETIQMYTECHRYSTITTVALDCNYTGWAWKSSNYLYHSILKCNAFVDFLGSCWNLSDLSPGTRGESSWYVDIYWSWQMEGGHSSCREPKPPWLRVVEEKSFWVALTNWPGMLLPVSCFLLFADTLNLLFWRRYPSHAV